MGEGVLSYSEAALPPPPPRFRYSPLPERLLEREADRESFDSLCAIS